MEGVSIIETAVLQEVINKINSLENYISKAVDELEQTKKPYLTVKELMSWTGWTRDWITDNKQNIGYSKIAGLLMFKRKDVEEFIQQGYHKVKRS